MSDRAPPDAAGALGLGWLPAGTRAAVEAEFYGLVEAAPDAWVFVDERGRIVLVNTRAEALFGYGREELLGQPVELLVPERFRVRHRHHRQRYAADPRPRPMGVGLDLYGRRRDGSEFPIEVSLSPLRTATGTLVISAIRDVTARRQAEAARAQLLREQAALRDLDRLKSELLVMLSHELRGPLSVIHGYAQLLAAQAPSADPAWIAQAAARIYARSTDLSCLVDDLLDFELLERGEVKIAIEDFDLAPMLRELVEEWRHQQAGDRLTGSIPRRLPVRADPQRLRQALSHLVENALKYAPESAVRLRATAPRGRVRVEVEDRGPGIAPDEQRRIWEKLYRGRGVAGLNVAHGSGIGLAVVKALVEAQGGHVGLESTPGLGACFWVELPAPRARLHPAARAS